MHPIGEASRRSGVTVETIRYYEREGIVPAPGRSTTGRRVYSRAEIGRLRFIRRCRDLGFAISEIRALLQLLGAGEQRCADVGSMGMARLRETRQKIEQLRELEAALAQLVHTCGEGRMDCAMLNALMADAGPEPI